MVLMSTKVMFSGVNALFKLSAIAMAVSIEVRHGMASSTALRRMITQLLVGILPFFEVEII